MAVVALSLGSNMGDREKNIKRAVKLIEKEFGPLKISPVYEAPPFYDSQKGQENFYNCCVSFESEPEPHEIFKKTSAMEKKMGRKDSYPNAPREIDIDIILVDDIIIADETLTIPHTGLQDRKFVLKPLKDILENFVHPAIGLSIKDLYYECPDRSRLKKLKGFWKEEKK